jgi:transcriptional regulator with XRE-family HTH domain
VTGHLAPGPVERQAAVAARLRRLRTAADLPAGDLAAAAGLDPAYYQDVEAGRADLTALTYLDLLRLADALDVPPAELLADPVVPAPRRAR